MIMKTNKENIEGGRDILNRFLDIYVSNDIGGGRFDDFFATLTPEEIQNLHDCTITMAEIAMILHSQMHDLATINKLTSFKH